MLACLSTAAWVPKLQDGKEHGILTRVINTEHEVGSQQRKTALSAVLLGTAIVMVSPATYMPDSFPFCRNAIRWSGSCSDVFRNSARFTSGTFWKPNIQSNVQSNLQHKYIIATPTTTYIQWCLNSLEIKSHYNSPNHLFMLHGNTDTCI